MKILLSIILLTSFSTLAQRNFYSVTNGDFMTYYEYGWQYSQLLMEKDKFKENKVDKIEVTKYSKRNENTVFEYFDQEGRVIKIENFYNGKKYTNEYSYDQNGNIIQLKNTDHNGNYSHTNYSYNDDNKILKSEKIDKKGKYFARVRTYNDEGKITSFLIYEKDKENPIKELFYSYYPEGSKKQTIYKVKGKVKYTWNFECSEEGEIENDSKKETKVCILKEQDADGNEVIWTREFHKGELRKTKTVNSKEGMWISIHYYNEKDELVSERIRNVDGGVTNLTRNKKGEMEKRSESILNEDGKLFKYTYFNKRWGYTYIYHYEGELLVSRIRVNGKRMYAEEYNYSKGNNK